MQNQHEEDDTELVRVPHLSWSGPGPEKDIEKYLLAILVRLAATGHKKRKQRTPDMPPSVMKECTARCVAPMFAYMREVIKEQRAHGYVTLIALLRESAKVSVKEWSRNNKDLVQECLTELMKYTEQPGKIGFSCYG